MPQRNRATLVPLLHAHVAANTQLISDGWAAYVRGVPGNAGYYDLGMESELGVLLGLDRVPEVKTLRRKLRELGERHLADTFTRRLTERWAKAAPRELALLYVDGHVRPYHGRTHSKLFF